eukprot:c12019_g1_i1.p1 GENE.c12019_g1_i1~~c12019_g1_i1.p1  ORF type:complete len:1765 (-),score=394.92 c12019_g1_i1:39-5249(-)
MTMKFDDNSRLLIDCLLANAKEDFDAVSLRWLDENAREVQNLTRGALVAEIHAVAHKLRHSLKVERGARVILMFPPGLEFICAFIGCLMAGVVAVPQYPIDIRTQSACEKGIIRLTAVVERCGAQVCLTTTSYNRARSVAGMMLRLQTPWPKSLTFVPTGKVGKALSLKLPNPTECCYSHLPVGDAPLWDNLAFVQFTSGSTGVPKGVMVSHRNMTVNMDAIKSSFHIERGCTYASWLPLYHDMGLISMLLTIRLGELCVLTSPVSFIKNPSCWLQMITKYKAKGTAAPNFAYDLCVRKVKPAEMEQLDLSSLEFMLMGAEPNRAETIQRFTTVFASCGLRRFVLMPSYGLAEHVLYVSSSHTRNAHAVPSILTLAKQSLETIGGRIQVAMSPSTLAPAAVLTQSDDFSSVRLVGCGFPSPNFNLKIVAPSDPEAAPEPMEALDEDIVGEICVQSDAKTQGYWGMEELTQSVFHGQVEGEQGTFLRTGDLGFIHKGELFVCGRFKDLIIIRGRNIYPQDVELAVDSCHAGTRPGCCAAFAVADWELGNATPNSEDGDTGERLVVVCEVRDEFTKDAAGVSMSIRRAVAEQFQVPIGAVVLVKQKTIPKTTSGKIRRSACKAAFVRFAAGKSFNSRKSITMTAAEMEAVLISSKPSNPSAGKLSKKVNKNEADADLVVVHSWSETEQVDPRELVREASMRRMDSERAGEPETVEMTVLSTVKKFTSNNEVELDMPLVELGLDSIGAVELVEVLNDVLGVDMPPAILLEHANTCADLAKAAAKAVARKAGEEVSDDEWDKKSSDGDGDGADEEGDEVASLQPSEPMSEPMAPSDDRRLSETLQEVVNLDLGMSRHISEDETNVDETISGQLAFMKTQHRLKTNMAKPPSSASMARDTANVSATKDKDDDLINLTKKNSKLKFLFSPDDVKMKIAEPIPEPKFFLEETDEVHIVPRVPSMLRLIVASLVQLALVFVIAIVCVGPCLLPAITAYRWVYGSYLYSDSYHAYHSSVWRVISRLGYSDVIVCFKNSILCEPFAGVSKQYWHLAPFLLIPVMLMLLALTLGIAAVCIKWIVVGRFKPGYVAYWSVRHIQLWFVESFIWITSSYIAMIFPDSLAMTLFNKCLGAHVSWSAHTSCLFLGQPDLVTIHDNANVSPAARLETRVSTPSGISYRRLVVGKGARVKAGAIVQQACLGDGVCIEPMAVVPAGCTLTEGSWNGVGDQFYREGPSNPSKPLNKLLCLIKLASWFAAFSIALAIMVQPAILVHDDLMNWSTDVLGPKHGRRIAVAIEVGMALFTLCLMVVVLKYALLGRLGLGRHEGTWLVIRHMIVHRLFALLYGQLLVMFWNSPLLNLYYRLLGARVAMDVCLSLPISDWDSVNVEEGVLIGGGVTLKSAQVEGDGEGETCAVVMLETRIGRGSLIAQKTIIDAGTKLGDKCTVEPITYIPVNFATTFAEPQVGGVPVKQRSRSLARLSRNKLSRASKTSFRLSQSEDMEAEVDAEANSSWSKWSVIAARGAISTGVILLLLGFLYVCALAPMEGIDRLIPSRVDKFGVVQGSFGTDMLFIAMPASLVAFHIMYMLLFIVFKWVVIYKYTERDLNLYSVHGVRWYVAMYFWAFLYKKIPWLAGTPMVNLFFNLLGAKVHSSAYFGAMNMYDFDLVTVEKGAVIGPNVTLSPHVINSPTGGVLRPVIMHEHSCIDSFSLLLGASMDAGAVLPPNVYAMPGRRIKVLQVPHQRV